MGSPAFRIGDPTSGHAAFPPRKAIAGSSNVFINGLGAVREGDEFGPHNVGSSVHTLAMDVGSSTVFINGKSASRVGDVAQCGEYALIGSNNVFIGG